MASNALASAKAESAIASARHSSSLARLRAKSDATLANMRGRLREYKAAERVQAAGMYIATDAGAVLAGQLAKPTVLVNKEGKPMGYIVNYVAGLGSLALLFGARPSMAVLGVAAGMNGMFAGQLAIDSKEKWNLNPFANGDQP